MTALAPPLYIATGVLILAGLAKLFRPSATAGALQVLSIPSPLRSARLLGAAEVALGLVAIATGNAVAWAGVGVSYLAFTVFVLWSLADPTRVGSCGCFGREDTPATPGHAAFNAAAGAIAFIAVAEPVRLSSFDGSAFEAVLAVLCICTGIALSIAALTVLPRTMSLVHGTAAPTITEFALTTSNTPRGIHE